MSIEIEPRPSPITTWEAHGTCESVAINMPGTGTIVGTLNKNETEPPLLIVGLMSAELPGNGAGKELLVELFAEGSLHGAQFVRGHFTTPAALGAFASLVGKDNISFGDWLTLKPADVSFTAAMKTPSHFKATAPLPIVK